mmetsp:Transcript_5701/g.4326  ORF Transcript_5701/g.4326 Transcript_5701/m.4326 type:complete len:89 (+) Transcript_5701:110-376(+)
MMGTMKYAQNIQKIAKKFWPKRQKANLVNFFFVGTAQAIFFSSFYIGGTMLILGINPWALKRSLFEEIEQQELSTDDDKIAEQVKDLK